jgi:hypothetical protein
VVEGGELQLKHNNFASECFVDVFTTHVTFFNYSPRFANLFFCEIEDDGGGVRDGREETNLIARKGS